MKKILFKFKLFLAEHSKLYREYNKKRVEKLNKELIKQDAGYIYAPYVLQEHYRTITN